MNIVNAIRILWVSALFWRATDQTIVYFFVRFVFLLFVSSHFSSMKQTNEMHFDLVKSCQTLFRNALHIVHIYCRSIKKENDSLLMDFEYYMDCLWRRFSSSMKWTNFNFYFFILFLNSKKDITFLHSLASKMFKYMIQWNAHDTQNKNRYKCTT